MYAVINAGGKQARVEVGEQLDVELLTAGLGDEVNFTPKLVVDGDEVVSGRDSLAASSVTATVVGRAAGPKIIGFTYKAKARGRRRYGHRQHYTTVEITGIDVPGRTAKTATREATTESPAAESDAGTASADD